MKITLSLLFSFLTLITSACATTHYEDPSTSEVIDIERYMGLWYEIARFENSFQKKCGETTAQYSLREDGKVNVLNTCKLKSKPSKLKQAKAIAYVKNKRTNAVLGVSFVPFFNRFGWFSGDYRILDIGPNYEWVIVGDLKREYFWVLSRTPTIDEELYEELLDKAQSLGYDTTKVIKSPTWSDMPSI